MPSPKSHVGPFYCLNSSPGMKMNGEGKKKHDCLQDFRHLLFSLNAQEGREELLHVQDQEGQP